MIDIARVTVAVDGFLAAAFLGEGFESALAALAEGCGARDAVLMRNTRSRLVKAFATDEASDAVAAFVAGKAPPNSRYSRVRTSLRGGFRVDHDDYSPEDLAADPFYQDFLRPRGVFWHANAILADNAGDCLELSLKRRHRLGPYDRRDALLLDRTLHDLRAAARIARATLDARAEGMASLLAQRGRHVIELDGAGRPRPGPWIGDTDRASPLTIAGRRLSAAEPAEQAALDHAVAAAITRPARLGLALLTARGGERYVLQVHPVPGGLRDLFLSAAALAVLIPRDPAAAHPTPESTCLAAAFGLTDREVEIAALLSRGHDLPTIARESGLRPETVRTYLKVVFEKTGTRRQAELVALLAQFRA
ncbi:MAG: helix-turn-helix transcriptional regulator [Halothiobacillaceae bacterium]